MSKLVVNSCCRFEIGSSSARIGVAKFGQTTQTGVHRIEPVEYSTWEATRDGIQALTYNSFNSAGRNLGGALSWLEVTDSMVGL